ncbi:MAG: phosphoribosylamine--glycine ligase [Elusimicrobia bacterium]|nr:phosphoribosylamine--glycine ligase [Elusimicrobiota bacterium]
MSVLILGAGGREHALAWKCAQSPLIKKLFAAPGSDAISALAECSPLDIDDGSAIAAFCAQKKIGLVIVGPEAPLAKGVADGLRSKNINVFGPGKDGARLEFSKAYAKEFMKRHGIPTARFEVFTEAQMARSAAEAKRLPLVLKADGLAAGKGVFVCKTTNEALGAVTELMEHDSLGEAGRTVILEDCLTGPELSVLFFCDGKDYRLLPASRDHKRLKDNDEGPNTGGMGVFAPVPVEPALMERIKTEVLERIMKGLAADGIDYRGLLYAGLMLTPEGPKVLEFNCRFGDPETQALMPLLDSDLVEIALACADGKLKTVEAKAKSGACVCVTLASPGYPAASMKGLPISGLESVGKEALVFHAGTKKGGKDWLTNGGRVLGVTALGSDIARARDNAYAAVSKIAFEGMQYRSDIAARALALK